MLKLIRRISVGVIPRPDRPWDEDPTSNAPWTSRKRRLSSVERDDDDEGKAGKKVRGNSATPSVADADATFSVPTPELDAKEVKEVTQGVKEVELEDKSEEIIVAPETIPLPDEKSGELDEPTSDDTSTPSHDAGAPDDTSSAQVGVEESTSIPTSIEGCEGPKHDEKQEKEKSNVPERTNDLIVQEAQSV